MIMIIKKINLVKKSGENTYNYYPASSSDVITYEESLTVKDVIDSIVDSVDQIENKLARNNIYMVNSSGEIITDESGTGLVELL